jgi:hypothetical protein
VIQAASLPASTSMCRPDRYRASMLAARGGLLGPVALTGGRLAPWADARPRGLRESRLGRLLAQGGVYSEVTCTRC